MNTMRTLGKDVVLIAHDKEDKDNDTRIVRPDVIGGSYGEVFKISDFIGYVYMSGKQRILDFNPTDKWIGKNPAQWKPFEIPPVDKATDFLAKIIDDARKSLGAISQASTAIQEQVKDWRAKLSSLTLATEFNREIPIILRLSPDMLKIQVRDMLKKYAAEQGLIVQNGEFVAPQVKAAEETLV